VAELREFGFDTIWVDSLPTPAQVEFIVAVLVMGLPQDFVQDAQRDAEVYLIGPGPDPLDKAEALIAMQFEIRTGEPNSEAVEGWEIRTVLPLVIRFTPRVEGHHLMEFYVNGRAQRCFIPLRVRLKEPSSQTG
jgi:hypothetical protein